MNRDHVLRRRIRLLTWFFIVGLVLSGATAIPLQSGVDLLVNITGADAVVSGASSLEPAADWAVWLVNVQSVLRHVDRRFPFLFYGTDWLAFGHFAIALAFVGALLDPVRNRWLYTFGLLACVLVIPYAFIFGGIRGIPIWWRLIDCSFGIIGFVPLWFCRKWAIELEKAM